MVCPICFANLGQDVIRVFGRDIKRMKVSPLCIFPTSLPPFSQSWWQRLGSGCWYCFCTSGPTSQCSQRILWSLLCAPCFAYEWPPQMASRRHTIRLAQYSQKDPFYLALFKSSGLEEFHEYFFKAWGRGRSQNESRQSQRIGFILKAGNPSGKASICDYPIKVSGLGNCVSTFQIKKMKAEKQSDNLDL